MRLQLPHITVLLSTAVSAVLGHGYVQEATLGKNQYTGYLPYSDPYYSPPPQRIFRQIPGNGPVTDLSKLRPLLLILGWANILTCPVTGLIDVQCNGYTDGDYYTAPAPLVGSYVAGSTISLNWTTWPGMVHSPYARQQSSHRLLPTQTPIRAL